MDLFAAVIAGIIILLVLFAGFLIGFFIARTKTNHEWQDKLPVIRETAVKQSRAVLAGQFSEQLAPYLPDFPYSPSEARFVGKPIDFIVFKGLDSKNPEEVIFVEVKSGKSQISVVEKKLKNIIESKKISWKEYRVPEGLTNNKQ